MACPEDGSLALLEAFALQPPSPQLPSNTIRAAVSQLPLDTSSSVLDVTEAWIRAVSQLPPSAAATLRSSVRTCGSPSWGGG